MPEEVFVIVLIGIIAGTLSRITTQFFNYLKSKGSKATSDASMTTSELEGMIQKWIVEATRPLVDRLENIEEKLDIDLNESQVNRKSILDDMDGFEEAGEKEIETRRRTKG